VAVDVLRLHHLGVRLLGALSRLAAGDGSTQGLSAGTRATPSRRMWRTSRSLRALDRQARDRLARGHREIAGTADDRARASDGAVRQQLRACHGAAAAPRATQLNADRWLWGGTLKEIQTTITHGARWDADKDTHSSLMPSFGKDAF